MCPKLLKAVLITQIQTQTWLVTDCGTLCSSLAVSNMATGIRRLEGPERRTKSKQGMARERTGTEAPGD